jgi:cytochrome d ubiquinol oxidase subunit I
MDHISAARALMGISLGFHIIYVAFGIGFPLLLLVAEGMALKTGNEIYHHVARSWTRPIIMLFAIGAVSGTILSFELGLLWPVFMGWGGPMIGTPFWLEGFAFFTEAIFLGLYAYGEKRLSRRAFFLTTIPITLASMASAVFVISANGWMNTPSGFDMLEGKAANVRPFQAMANPAWLHEALHGTLATYVAACFAIAGVYAYQLLRGRETPENRFALSLSLAIGGILVPFMLVTGDLAATSVAADQPAKLAAMELVPETVKGAPMVMGGWLDHKTNQVRYGVPIPYLLSLLAYRDPHARVLGLDAFPPGLRPNPNMVHPFFDLMVLSFFIMFAAMLWFWIARWKKKEVYSNRRLLMCIIAASPFGLLAQEFGWFVTEFGRQPWIARGFMLVKTGATPRGVEWVLILFVLVYLALAAGLLKLLLTPAPVRSGVKTRSKSGISGQKDNLL